MYYKSFNFIMSFDIKIIQKLALKKLITVQLQENVLQNNFQIILKALKAQDQQISTLHKCCKDLQNNQINDRFANEKYMQKMNNSIIKLEKQMLSNNIKVEQLDKNQEKLQNKITNSLNGSLAKMEELMKKINEKVDTLETKVQENVSQLSKISYNPENKEQDDKYMKTSDFSARFLSLESKLNGLDREIKDINLNILSQSQRSLRIYESIKRQKVSDNIIENGNKREKINDNIFENANKTKNIREQQPKHNKTRQLIINNEQMGLSQRIEKINTYLMNKFDMLHEQNEHQRKKNAKRFQQMQSQLQSLSRFVKTHTKQHSNLGQQPKDSHSNRLKTDLDTSGNTTDKDNSTFKKEFQEKLKDLKENLIKTVKKMDKYTAKLEEDKFNLDRIEDRLYKLQAVLKDKADKEAFSKWIKNIDNKFKFVENLYLKFDENGSAIATKHQLSCLSCDHKLKNFKASGGIHLLSDRSKSRIKTYEGQSVLLKSSSKYEMPQLRK